MTKAMVLDEKTDFTSGAIALQHYLLSLVANSSQGWGELGRADNTESLIENTISAIDVPQGNDRDLVDALPNASDFDRSLLTDELKFRHRVQIPRDSKAEFVLIPVSNEPESYTLRIRRVGYYTLDLRVSRYYENDVGFIPEIYQVNPTEDRSHLRTYYYLVKMDASIQRINDPSFIAIDYEEWSRALFSNLRAKLEH